MKKEPKKYIVTFQESHVPTQQAQEILGLSKRDYKEGVNFLSSEEEQQDADVLNFEELGIASLTLSETEVTKLKKNNQIMAVEEDVEMHILEVEDVEMDDIQDIVEDDVLFDDFENEALTDESPYYSENFNHVFENDLMTSNSYQLGAAEMMKFVLQSLTSNNDSSQSSEFQDSANLRYPRPPFNRLPFPRIPFPRFPRWPIVKPQPIPWNINLVKAPLAWRRGITGRGVKVAVLDTGIAKHPDLTIKGGVSFIPRVTSYNDGHSHGTHCAGIIAAKNNFHGVVGVAPNASLYAVKVLSDSGSGRSSWIIAGMNWCIANRIDIASMSLGGANPPSTAYAHAVRRCQNAGVTVVVASGNSYRSSFPWVCSPANSVIPGTPSASPLAVGAIDKNCRIAPFSSRGGRSNPWNQIDVVAPGVSVKSTVLRNGYSSKSGTSMACPHVAGAAALIKQRYPNINPLQIKARLQRTSTDLGRRGYDTTFGSGLINCDRATR